MMSSVETNVTVVTHSSPPPVPIVTETSPALRFQYPLLQPLGIFSFPQGILEIVLRTGICVREDSSLPYVVKPLQVLAFITMVTAAVARANVDDIPLQGERYVDKSALRSVFGYSVAIAVFIMIIFVVIIVIRLLGFGIINQFWLVFGIMVSSIS